VIARLLRRAVVLAGVAGAVNAVELSVSDIAAPTPAPAGEQRPGQLPGSRIARGAGNIAAVWLGGPTSRYAHGVLGDRIEASRLVVQTDTGVTLALELPPSRVFEDLQPRLADLNNDGVVSILLVETDTKRGASLAVYAVENERIVRRSMTPFLGLPHRWLNPLGVGDFDGDGRTDIALVATPHIGGRLRLYRNTAPVLGLGRVVANADRDRLLLPNQSHDALLLLEWTPAGIKELARQALPAPILTSLQSTGANRWRFQTADGRHLEVRVH
jgi:hypothetical protein